MRFNSNAVTHIGLVRELNEDAYAERSDIGVWVVADGMGGHAAGEVASKAVTDSILSLSRQDNFDEMLEAVKHCLKETNRQLRKQADALALIRAPGSTVVVLIINGFQGAVVWAGDSRVYRCRDRKLTQLTRDHSHVQSLVDQGLIKAEEAESHPLVNIITRAIGILEPVDLDTRPFDVKPGDQFLLCSDGLCRMVSNQEIESALINMSSEDAVQSLLQSALDKGATDNVTLIHVSEDDN